MAGENYNKKVINKFLHPKNMGEIKNADAVGEVGNMKCGDVMKVYLKIKDNKIKDIKFQTLGCVAAIASTDVVCDLAKGKSLSEAKKISKKEILKKLGGLPGIKVHCSVLGEEAIRDAVKNYREKPRQSKK
jgi:nitrogen fixation NifU-like protein